MCYCQRGSETCREQYSSAGTLPTRVTPHVNWATIGAISQSAIGRKRRHRWSNKRKTGAYASRFNVPVWLNEFPLFPTFFEGFQLFAEGTLPGLWEDLHCWLHEQMWLVSWGGKPKNQIEIQPPPNLKCTWIKVCKSCYLQNYLKVDTWIIIATCYVCISR